jgi:hypothetical protein
LHPTIPRRKSRSCADPAGLGYHTLHGAPSCWTPVSKSCPGAVRKTQWRDVLLPAFLNPEGDDDMGLSADDKQWLSTKLEASERRTARYVDHGNVDTPGTNDHHERIRADISNLAAAVGARLDALEELLSKPPEPPA